MQKNDFHIPKYMLKGFPKKLEYSIVFSGKEPLSVYMLIHQIVIIVTSGHQHALESYPQFLALSLIGGIKFPISCAVGGLLWNYARLKVSIANAISVDRYLFVY